MSTEQCIAAHHDNESLLFVQYGRITVSHIHEDSRSETDDASLVDLVIRFFFLLKFIQCFVLSDRFTELLRLSFVFKLSF